MFQFHNLTENIQTEELWRYKGKHVASIGHVLRIILHEKMFMKVRVYANVCFLNFKLGDDIQTKAERW